VKKPRSSGGAFVYLNEASDEAGVAREKLDGDCDEGNLQVVAGPEIARAL
jgi:hypothetical protein